jgi:hypothetical protein
MKPLSLLAFFVIGLGLLVVYACQDTQEVTRPSAASAAVSFRLTITGLGTGNGVVTSSPSGINCTITAGVAATTGCTKLFTEGTSVRLLPSVPVAIRLWGGALLAVGQGPVRSA